MKTKYQTLKAVTLTASAILAVTIASAEDLPQTVARQQFSATKGFAATNLPVLQRASTANQSDVRAALIASLRPGENTSIEVSADGSAAEYHDLTVGARSHSLGRPVSQKMSAAELEQRGRAFIASKLAYQIVLGRGESLIALRADYRTEGGQDLTTGETSSAVVANRAVFGRMLDGVPVVGNGSTVIVTFSNDGALESFRYDWPAYQAGNAQMVVDAGEVLSRVQSVMSIRSGAPNSQLQALECGYYDSGSRVRKSNSVQPGCTYRSVSQGADGMRAGYAGAVPAGVSYAADAGWLETQLLAVK